MLQLVNVSDYRDQYLHLFWILLLDKSKPECDYYSEHEGVKILHCETSKYGFGVVDRYLESLLRMMELGAAISGGKLLKIS